ncbi:MULTISPECIES: phage tail assembly chaperone [unclassified Pseudomonas]|jgi:hypothetical protein|uniref:phage tail assembly chaperone n=1 Tax=unclassified Pseudomonas TaxID=196821 RepID=UPI001C88BF6F|nr:MULTISPECIES: phage tail assembly chaperone [unclassified Pseudomonas]MBX8467532.1 phage tail assembly chaperone [Pseudomonas sp. RIT778]UVM28621.1 phage tail assembly chaperone [Pseudomonas sp. B21-021]
MKIYWSPSTQGFFDSRVNTAIPKDAVEISPAHRDELMDGCRRNQVIVCRANGFPILADAAPMTPEDLANAERHWRDAQLVKTDPLITRHRDELETMEKTTLSAENYTTLQQYRRDLRDWPSSTQFPAIANRPDWSVIGDTTVKKTRARKTVRQ